MENLTVARKVDNATNQRSIVPFGQDNAISGECQACGYAMNPKSGPLSNWGAFPAGVKFDPSDEELLHHLRAENNVGSAKSHPFIKNFISVLEGEDGICQTHPERLPGVKMDGSSKHFFHRPAKAYTTGTRKRRKIHSDDDPGVETRWHKTGKTRPVVENGQALGWKKIMVLYRNTGPKKSKPEKTNWILHQYHLGLSEEETDGELVVCKVFYQKQPRQCTGGRAAEGTSEVENFDLNQGTKDVSGTCISEVSREPPVTPKVDEQRPRPTRPEPLGRGDAITQSSKNSELTVVCADTRAPVASELTSSHKNEARVPSARTNSLISGDQIICPLAQTLQPGVLGHGTSEWYDEASTADQPCEAENEDPPRGVDGDEPLFRRTDECHGLRTGFEMDSQQLFPDDAEIAQSLFCDEDMELFMDMEYNFRPLEDLGFSNPNEDYPSVDDILESPLELNTDFLLSSQEAQDVLNLRPCYTHLDNDDSLSST